MEEEKEKKFYWIKLNTNFFNQDTIDFLLSQKNGCEYIVLYQMLCLNTANNNGELSTKIGEMIVPYNIDKIVRDTKYFDVDTVTVALELFKRLGLIYEGNDNCLQISNFNKMVGSESANANAQRQKRFRERQKLAKLGVTNSNASNVTQNNEEYRDKRLEYRDKIIDIEKEKKEENNIVITSVNDSISTAQLEHEFNDVWDLYPRKQGKANALKSYIKARKKGTTKEEVINGIENYINYIKIENIKPQYIKQGSTWFNQNCWNDDYTINREITTKDLANNLDFSEFR